MLFLFDTDEQRPFWMKDCFIPLDLVWLDENYAVADISRDVPPCQADPCPNYSPSRAIRNVLELQGGLAASHRLSVGDRLVVVNLPPERLMPTAAHRDPKDLRTPTRPQLHIYTGDGKGKTTACIGLPCARLAPGMKVHFIQFDKGFDGQNEHYAERHILRGLANLRLDPTGCERIQPDGHFRFGVTSEDKSEALRALALARDALRAGEANLVILDEILSAQQVHLISEQDILDLDRELARSRSASWCCRPAPSWPPSSARADLVTEMRKVKHYYDAGLLARRGIDF